MNNLEEQLKTLLKVQDCDRRILRYQKEANSIPDRAAEINAKLNKYRETIDKLREDLKNKHVETKNHDGQVEMLREKIIKLRQQQFELKTNTEYKASEKEIKHVESQISDIELKTIALMEASESIEQSITDAETELAKNKDSIESELKELDARKAELVAELEKQKQQRNRITEPVDPDILLGYDRIMNHVADFAVVEIRNGSCGGCHMNLPAQVSHNVKRCDAIVSCDFCGRLLFGIN